MNAEQKAREEAARDAEAEESWMDAVASNPLRDWNYRDGYLAGRKRAEQELKDLDDKIMETVRAINTVQGLLMFYQTNSGSACANAKMAWNRNAKALTDLFDYQTRYLKERHMLHGYLAPTSGEKEKP